MSSTTHLLQDGNNFTLENKFLKINKQVFYFRTDFYQFMKKNETTFNAHHFSVEPFCYFYFYTDDLLQ